MGSILAVVERAYKGTLEEQEDAALWITAALVGAGSDMAVLLRGNAVSYAQAGQDASGLNIGGVALKVPPAIDRDVDELIGKGIPVYVVEEDLAARGIGKDGLVGDVLVVKQADLAGLWQRHESVWHW